VNPAGEGPAAYPAIDGAVGADGELTMGRKDDDGAPTLAEAWAMIGEQYALAVEETGKRSIRAQGNVRGRAVSVEIDGEPARSEFARFFFGINTVSSRNRREKWHTRLSVGCTNPAGVTGTIRSVVDVNDPAWKPGEYDPRKGRHVTADPASLAERALTADTHERLMSIMDDISVEVQPGAIVLDHHNKAMPGSHSTYVAGSVIHHYQGSPPPWPQRAIAGPPWWIDLLCDLADTVDR
jgi:hypothetical protein